MVTMSLGDTEWDGETASDSDFTTPGGHNGVTFVASAGDWGAPRPRSSLFSQCRGGWRNDTIYRRGYMVGRDRLVHRRAFHRGRSL